MSDNVIETFINNGGAALQVVPDTRKPVAIIGAGQKAIDLEQYLESPLAIEETREFDDLRGLVGYIKDYKTDTTVAFANRDRVEVVFDYHGKDSPRWGRHSVTFKYRRSPRWQLWEKKNNQWMNQEDFADFLDTGLNEITHPNQSDVLDIIKNFRATVNAEAISSIGQGGTHLEYRQTTKGGSVKATNIEVPEHITVRVSPYDGLQSLNSQISDEEKQIPVYEFRAKLSWRLKNKEAESPDFKFQLLNFENAVDETLESVRVAIHELTGVVTYIGG